MVFNIEIILLSDIQYLVSIFYTCVYILFSEQDKDCMILKANNDTEIVRDKNKYFLRMIKCLEMSDAAICYKCPCDCILSVLFSQLNKNSLTSCMNSAGLSTCAQCPAPGTCLIVA